MTTKHGGSENPRRPTERTDVPVSMRDPNGGDDLLVIGQVAYLEMMEQRDPQKMTQSDWLRAWERYGETGTDKPPEIMPPSYDRSLLTPGGWSRDCDPLHGIILRDLGVFVRRTHHEDDADGAWIAVVPTWVPEVGVSHAEAQAQMSARGRGASA